MVAKRPRIPDPTPNTLPTPEPLPDSPLPIWSRRLKELRSQHGWSQQQLCDAAGGDPPLATATISTIERGGHTTTDTLQRVATAFGVPICLLFLEDEDGMLSSSQVGELVGRLGDAALEVLKEFQKRRL